MSGSERDRPDGRRPLVTGGSKGPATLSSTGCGRWGRWDVTARTMSDGYEQPDRFIEAHTASAEGATAVATGIAEADGALDILVRIVGGASTPAGGFTVITDEQWLSELGRNFLGRPARSRAAPGDDRVRGVWWSTSPGSSESCTRTAHPRVRGSEGRASQVTTEVSPTNSRPGACASTRSAPAGSRPKPKSGSETGSPRATVSLETNPSRPSSTHSARVPVGRFAHTVEIADLVGSWSPTAPRRASALSTSSTAERSDRLSRHRSAPTGTGGWAVPRGWRGRRTSRSPRPCRPPAAGSSGPGPVRC
jgi:hypothetical protein